MNRLITVMKYENNTLSDIFSLPYPTLSNAISEATYDFLPYNTPMAHDLGHVSAHWISAHISIRSRIERIAGRVGSAGVLRRGRGAGGVRCL